MKSFLYVGQGIQPKYIYNSKNSHVRKLTQNILSDFLNDIIILLILHSILIGHIL